MTPLHVAVLQDDAALISLLLHHGAQVDSADKKGLSTTTTMIMIGLSYCSCCCVLLLPQCHLYTGLGEGVLKRSIRGYLKIG